MTTESKAMIRCKPCDRTMTRLDWMKNKTCDNPNCRCPEVQKVAAQVTKVIDKAKQQAGYSTAKIVTPIPTQYDGTGQYYMDVEPLVVYEISRKSKK